VADLAALATALGQQVVRVRRGRFIHPRGEVQEGGFVELTFASGGGLLLDTASDWTLTAQPGPWLDPFTEPLSDEDREFVDEHGRWTAVDESGGCAEPLIGAVIEAAPLAYNDVGEADGVQLVTERAVLNVVQQGGELRAKVERR
jgi:hypothetical protein